MIVRLNGGLGNQLFQYAFGQSLSIARCEPVFYHKFNLDNGNHRAYALDVFNTNVAFKEPDNFKPVYQERTFAYDKGVLDASPDSYFVGNWQTEKYFVNSLIRKDVVPRKTLTQSTVAWKTKILNKAKPTCSIHVRRTDYLNVQHYHGSMDVEWYKNAIEHIKSEVPSVLFFVFSDDHAWCRDIFTGNEFSVVSGNGMGNGDTGPSTEHEDLYLMSLCEHAIIPNSSFGWWGAWLGDQVAKDYNMQRIVVAPKDWFNPTGPAKNLDTSDIVPARWLRL